MIINFNSDVPIYIQLTQMIKEGILCDVYLEENQIPSTTEMSIHYKINPATVLKGYNILVDESIVYKKRGVGMFVCVGAKQKILNERKNEFCERYLKVMLNEAKTLNIGKDEIIKYISEEWGNEQD